MKRTLGNITYELHEKEKYAAVIKCKDNAIVANISSSVNGLPVSRIEKFAFGNCKKLSKVVIPNSILAIDDYAFSFCKSLKEIIFPDFIKRIGNNAFYFCNSIKNVTIPFRVDIIGTCVFQFCTSLENVVISEGIKEIPEGTFESCISLVNVLMPDTIKKIGNYAFSNCRSLKNVKLSNSLETIGKYSFANCLSLENISIPFSVKRISDFAFHKCHMLSQAILPESTKFKENSFENCCSLKTITYSKLCKYPFSVGDYVYNVYKHSIVRCDKVLSISNSSYKDELGEFSGLTRINKLVFLTPMKAINALAKFTMQKNEKKSIDSETLALQIDEKTFEKVNNLFNELGLDMYETLNSYIGKKVTFIVKKY